MYKIDYLKIVKKMDIDFYIILFIIFPLLTVLCIFYYIINYLYIDNNVEEDAIYNINDIPELELKYPEKDVVELQIDEN